MCSYADSISASVCFGDPEATVCRSKSDLKSASDTGYIEGGGEAAALPVVAVWMRHAFIEHKRLILSSATNSMQILTFGKRCQRLTEVTSSGGGGLPSATDCFGICGATLRHMDLFPSADWIDPQSIAPLNHPVMGLVSAEEAVWTTGPSDPCTRVTFAARFSPFISGWLSLFSITSVPTSVVPPYP